MQIGVISDTHGRFPAAVVKTFETMTMIIHAGDIGDQRILDTLGKIAPTMAVRGNMDMGRWAQHLPREKIITIGMLRLCVLHDAMRFQPEAQPDACHALIHGHTHRPEIQKIQGVLYLNPGSAVQPRFGYPPSVAILTIQGTSIKARLVEL